MAHPDPKDVARCAAYKALLDDHHKSLPRPYLGYPSEVAMMAGHYIQCNMPEDARHYVARCGVPNELIVAVDALIKG